MGDFKLYDKNGNKIYCEYSDGIWYKSEYYNNNEIYYEEIDGYWIKKDYDENDNLIYCEDSNGVEFDNRPKLYDGKVVKIEGKLY